MLVLDLVGTVGTATVGILSPTAYPAANRAEGLLGVTSATLTVINDFAVTGDRYFTNEPTYQFVISSDVAISGVFALARGNDPEPLGDTLINGSAAVYDYYRMTGNDPVFEVHIGIGWWVIDSYHENGH